MKYYATFSILWKFNIISLIFFLNFTTKNVAFFLSIIDSYGDYLFAISIDIYHELSEYR